MKRNSWLCLAVASACLTLTNNVLADGNGLREELDTVPATATLGGARETDIVTGRLAGRKALSLKDSSLAWKVKMEDDYLIEFWLRPGDWNALTETEVPLCVLDIGKRAYRLYKPAGQSSLVLESDGKTLQHFPIYTWTEQAWMGKNEQVRWQYINIGVKNGRMRLTVNGFAAAGDDVATDGGLNEFTLAGAPGGTAFSELNIAPGVVSGEALRSRYRNLYRGVPSLRENTVTVPWVDKAPVLDGAIGDDEYAGMTRLTGFNSIRPDNVNPFEESGVSGYLGYDGSNLYLALETPYQGELQTRKWGFHDAALEMEECYEIFLFPPWTGTPDYVQLMVNPHGDTADLRNFVREWRGRWDWEARIGKDAWTGELRAPFAGLLFPHPGDSDIWTMNIINTKANAAWNPVSFYNDIRGFVTLRFDRDAPVIRPGDITVTANRIGVPMEIVGRRARRDFTVGMEIYGDDDLLPVLNIEKTMSAEPDERVNDILELDISGLASGLAAIYVMEGDTYLYCRTGKFPLAAPVVRSGAPKTAATPEPEKAELEEKKELTEAERAYARKWTAEELGQELLAMEEWSKGLAGRTPGVMSPWTPLEVRNREIDCWGRSYRYGETLFPAAVTSQGEELLAGTPYFLLRQGETVHKLREATVAIEQVSDELVRVTTEAGAGKVKLSIVAEYEYDGMGKFTVTLAAPDEAVAIDSLELVLPVKQSKAALFHIIASYSGHPPATNSGAVPEDGMIFDRFRELIWLGDTRTGFCWFAESMKGWRLSHENGIQKVERLANGDVNLRIAFANKPFTLDTDLTLVFGLQATPTRPRKPDFRVKSDISSMEWNWFWGDGQYYPFQRNPAAARRQVDAQRQRGREVMPCSSLMYHGTVRFHEGRFGKIEDPGLTHREILLWEPLWRHQRRFYDASLPEMPERHTARGNWYGGRKFTPQGLTGLCANSPFQNYYLWRVEQLVKDTGVGAWYLDQPVAPCHNAHHGCGYINYKGEWAGTVPIFAQREMLKRLRRIFYDAHGDARIRWHMSSQILVPVMSFADTFWDGENYLYGPLKVYEFYSRTLPEDRMLAQHTGIQFGFAPDLLPQIPAHQGYAPTPASTRDMMGMFWIFDNNVFPVGNAHLPLIRFLQRKRLSYGLDDMNVAYYWEPDGPVKSLTEDIRHILHYDKGKALLILFNWSDKVTTARLEIDTGKMFKVTGAPLKDAENGETIAPDGDVYLVPMAPRDFRMLEIGQQQTK